MDRFLLFTKRWGWLFVMATLALASGIAIITLPNAVPTANKRGNSNVFQLALNNSATTAGSLFCDDGNGNVTTSGCNTSGTGAAGANIFSATASKTVTATSATTLIGTVSGSTTIGANTFTAGQVLMVYAAGFYSTPATATSLQIDVLIGGTIEITTGSVLQSASVTNGTWRLYCGITTRTTGVSGTQIANCTFEETGATVTATPNYPMQVSSTWTVNTTTTNTFDIQATWSTATGSPTITSTNVAAWIPGAPVSSVYGLTGAVSPSSHNVSAAALCADTSASATTYTCSTTPTFTPASGDMVIFTSINQNNSGSSTLNVNSAGAKTIKKQQNAANLAANDLQASGQVIMTYDGTNWQMQGQIGNASGGGGGSFTLVEQHSASSSAELDFTTCISSTYDDYQIEIVQFIPATDNASVLMQVSTNGGSSYDTGSNYAWAAFNWITNATGTGGSQSTTSMALTNTGGQGSGGPSSFDGTVRFSNPGSASSWKNIISSATAWDTSGTRLIPNSIGGTYKSTTAVNAFRLLMSTGNIASGTARCYGLSK